MTRASVSIGAAPDTVAAPRVVALAVGITPCAVIAMASGHCRKHDGRRSVAGSLPAANGGPRQRPVAFLEQ